MVVFMDLGIRQIPMAALVWPGMIMVSIGTFSWESVRNLEEAPGFHQYRDDRNSGSGRRYP